MKSPSSPRNTKQFKQWMYQSSNDNRQPIERGILTRTTMELSEHLSSCSTGLGLQMTAAHSGCLGRLLDTSGSRSFRSSQWFPLDRADIADGINAFILADPASSRECKRSVCLSVLDFIL
jgi:hypothetical protein